MKLSKLKAPNTFFIIFSIIVLVAISTWFIPSGEFERKEVNGKNIVVNETFHYVESNPQGISAILQAPIKGFVDAALIIGFVVIVGGAFSVFQKTEAVDSAIKAIANAYHKSKIVEKLLIPILMILFSLGGAIFGMGEEIIPFILILVPLTLSLGYDSITAVAIAYIGSGVGFAGAFLNPFTVGIAQGIAGVPLFSGMEYRLVVWVIVTIIAIMYVTRYASKIKANPKLSPVYEIDQNRLEKFHINQLKDFSGIDKQHKIVLFVFLLGVITLSVGVLSYGWFIEEISAVFLI
ncbi:MAG: YfcC family protein, partial [Ignavibacteriae bacterium]|nr:YfcC family protein [Ignavibacteriota bacterium]